MKTCTHCNEPLQPQDSFCEECGAPVQEHDPMLGKNLLGQYMVKRRLGEGGFGAVYEADQPSMQRKIAIKTLHPHLSKRHQILARFRREGLAASKLQHPAAVKVYNLGETEEGIPWLSMEYVEGQTLDDRLKQGPLSIEECRRLLFPICDVLEEAHHKGIYHRDLKPQNIMIPTDTNGSPSKLLDFGLASLLESEQITAEGVVSGTPAYMAPEQWRGLSHTDGRSDLYSLGVVLYRCLTGKLPLSASSMPEWALKHMDERPRPLQELNPSIPPPIADAIMKCLAKTPEERFQSASELKHALEAKPEQKNAPSTLWTREPQKQPTPQPIHPPQPTPTPQPIPTPPQDPSLLLAPAKPNKKRNILIAAFISALLIVGVYLNATKIDPSEAIKEAATLITNKEYDKALALLEKIKEANPSSAKAYFLEGSIYQFKSQEIADAQDTNFFIYIDKACVAFAQYRRLDPSTTIAPHVPALMQEAAALTKSCQFP